MSRYAQVNVKFGADISEFSTSMQNAVRQMQRAGDQLQDVGKSLTMNLTAPIVALGAAALYSFGEIDALKRGLTSFAGSAEAAEAEFNKLKEIAKLPGIGLEEAVRGSNNLQAIGISADDARTAMAAFGNAIATVGGGRENFDLAIRGFGQLTNASKPLQQDLYQIANQLPQVNKLMKDAFGTNRAEELAAMGMSGKDLADFLVDALSKLPPMTGGIKNAFENMGDSVKISLGQLGESIDKTFDISGKITALAEGLSSITNGFANLNPSVQKFILITVTLVAALGPLLFIIGGMVKIFPLVVAGFAAIKAAVISITAVSLPAVLSTLAIVAAIAALAAAGAFVYANWNVISQKLKNLFIDLTTAILKRLQVLVNGLGKVFEFFGSSAFVGVESMFDHLVDSLPETKDAGAFMSFGESIKKTMADIKGAIMKDGGLNIMPEVKADAKGNKNGLSPSDKTTLGIAEKVNEEAKELKSGFEFMDTTTKAGLSNVEHSFTEAAAVLPERIKTMGDNAIAALQRWQEQVKQFNDQIALTLREGLNDQIYSVFDQIGTNLGNQEDPLKDIGKRMLESVGAFLQKMGSLWIAYGTAQALIETQIANPYVAIAAGAAMVAAGAAIKATQNKGIQKSGNYGSSSYSSGGSGGGQDLTLTTRLDGRDLVLSGQRTSAVTRR